MQNPARSRDVTRAPVDHNTQGHEEQQHSAKPDAPHTSTLYERWNPGLRRWEYRRLHENTWRPISDSGYLDFRDISIRSEDHPLWKGLPQGAVNQPTESMDSTQKDPNGLDAHTPGAKLDAGKIRCGLVIGGFAGALYQVSRVGTFGAAKYTPNGWRSVDGGFERYTDAMHRRLLAEAMGEQSDSESGILHAAHAAWNALARLQLLLDAKECIDE